MQRCRRWSDHLTYFNTDNTKPFLAYTHTHTHTCKTLDKSLTDFFIKTHIRLEHTHTYICQTLRFRCCLNKISPQTELAQVRRESLLSALSHLHNVCVRSSRWKCKMKHNYVVLPLTTALSLGALHYCV